VVVLLTPVSDQDLRLKQGSKLNAKARDKLLNTKYWQQLRELLEHGHTLMENLGTEEISDYNAFRVKVETDPPP